jgi:hypothetical protein
VVSRPEAAMAFTRTDNTGTSTGSECKYHFLAPDSEHLMVRDAKSSPDT